MNAPADSLSAPARVLIVDDDEGNLVALQAVLAGMGHDIVAARSGPEALRAVLRDEFAVILLDVRMPGMDGYETAELIRQRSRSRHVPIIFLSGVDKEAAHQFRGYAAGAVDYVLKPVEPLVLRSKVAVFTQLFEQRQQMRRTAEAERRLLAENLAVRAREAEVARALERSLAEQSLVLEALPLALFTAAADTPGARQFIGGNLQALSGHEGDAAQAGESWLAHVHPDDRPRLEAALAGLTAARTYDIEYRLGHGADERWMLEHGELREGEDGPTVYGVVTDVTARKRLEEQLAHAQKLEAIGQLSGGIAHDFNNMLGVVIGSLDRVLDRGDLDDRSRGRLELAMQAAQSCADLTKRLLGFARRQTLQPRLIDIAGELARLSGLFERVLGERVTTQVETDPDLPPVHMDASQLEGAIVNLAVNARDAMPDGGRLTVSARLADLDAEQAAGIGVPARRYIRLTIADTGTGMDAATQARAFEPFFTTKAPGRGTGLGLSSIYGFLRQSGGGLCIESELGAGTSIHLYLPPAPENAVAAAAAESEDVPAEPLTGLRVALVEDNAELRGLSIGMLEELGCVVCAHASGDDAARDIDPPAIDLLVTDCVMPGTLDGPALAARLRESHPALPVLFVSGFRAGTVPLPGDAAGFLAKPYDLPQLARALAELRPHRG